MADETNKNSIEFATNMEQASKSMESAVSKINVLVEQFNGLISSMSRRSSTYIKNVGDMTNTTNQFNSSLLTTIATFKQLGTVDMSSLEKFKSSLLEIKTGADALSSSVIAQFDKMNQADLSKLTSSVNGINSMQTELSNAVQLISNIQNVVSNLNSGMSELKTIASSLNVETLLSNFTSTADILRQSVTPMIETVRKKLATIDSQSKGMSGMSESIGELISKLNTLQITAETTKVSLSGMGSTQMNFSVLKKSFEDLQQDFIKLSSSVAPLDSLLKPLSKFINGLEKYHKVITEVFSNNSSLKDHINTLQSSLVLLSRVHLDASKLGITQYVQEIDKLVGIETKLTAFNPQAIVDNYNNLQQILTANPLPDISNVSSQLKIFSTSISSLNKASGVKDLDKLRTFLSKLSELSNSKGIVSNFTNLSQALETLNTGFSNLKITPEQVNTLNELATVLSDLSMTSTEDLMSVGEVGKRLSESFTGLNDQLKQFSESISLKSLDLTRFSELNTVIAGLKSSFDSLKTIKISDKNKSGLKDAFSDLNIALKDANTALANIKGFSNKTVALKEGLGILQEALATMAQMGSSKTSTAGLTKTMSDFNTALGLINNFKTSNLSNVSSEVSNLMNVFDELGKSLSKFSNLYSKVNKMPTSTIEILAYMRTMLSTVEKLNLELSSMSSRTGGIDKIGTEFSELTVTVNQLLNVFTQFNKLLHVVDMPLNVTPVISQFSQVGNLLNTLNSELQLIKSSGSGTFDELQNDLSNIRSIVSSVAKSLNSLQELSLRTFNLSGITEFENQLIEMSRILISVQSLFGNFSLSVEQIQGMALSIKEVNKLLTQMNSLMKKAKPGTDMSATRAYFTELMGIITELVNNVNSLNLSTTNVTSLTALLQSLTSAFSAVNKSSTSFNNSVNKQNSTLSQFNSNVKTSTVGLTDFGKAFKETGAVSGLNGAYNFVNKIRFGVQGLLFTLGGRTLWDWLIGGNSKIEDLTKSLEVVQGSLDKAKGTIIQLKSFAALTQFEEQETMTAGESLASNKMNVDQWIRVAGDLASAKKSVGIELQDTINIITRINAGDFGKATKRLRELGISLMDLKAQGLEFTKGNKFLGTTEEYLTAFSRIVNERYGGLTEELGKTVSGQIAKASDLISLMGMDVGKESFGELKEFLGTINDELKDFRFTPQFKEWVDNFNNAKDTVKELVSILEGPIKVAGKFLLDNVESIGQLLNVLILKSVSTTLVNGLMKITESTVMHYNNEKLIEAQMVKQQALLAEEFALNGGINGELTKRELKMAKILAMQKSQNTMLTEQSASEVVTNSMILSTHANTKQGSPNKVLSGIRGMSAVSEIDQQKFSTQVQTGEDIARSIEQQTGASSASNFALATASQKAIAIKNAKNLQAVTSNVKQNMQAVGSSVNETALTAKGAMLTGFQSTAMQGLKIAMALGVALVVAKAIAKAFSDSKEVNFAYSVDEYKELLGTQKEELSQLESLNKTRVVQANKLQLQTKKINELKDAQKDGTDVTNNLVDALTKYDEIQSNLIRTNSQILNIAPELNDSLYDEDGRVRDLTESYEGQTQAILDNIDARKGLYNSMKKAQVEQIGLEIDQSKNEIDRINSVLSMYDTAKTDSSIGRAGYGFLGAFGKLVGEDLGNAFFNLSGMNKTDDTASWENGTDLFKLLGQGPNDSQSTILAYKKQLNELQSRISENTGLLMDEKEKENILRSYGDKFLNTDGSINSALADTFWDKLEEAGAQALQKLENWPQRLEDIKTDVDSSVTKLDKEFEVRLNDILISGLDKDSEAYIKVLAEQADIVGSLYKQEIDDLTATANESAEIIKDKLYKVPDYLVSAIEAGYSLDSIYDIIQTDVSTWPDEFAKTFGAQFRGFKDLVLAEMEAHNLESSAKGVVSLLGEDNISLLDQYYEASQTAGDAMIDAMLEYQKRKISTTNSNSAKTKTAYEKFKELFSNSSQSTELNSSLKLQNAELASNNPEFQETQTYKNLENRESIKMREVILGYLSQLQDLIPTITDADEKRDAQIQALTLQKDANQLLLDIRKNTESIGEFNKPGDVNAITYYDYKLQSGSTQDTGMEIANASIVIKVDAIQNVNDVQKMMELIKSGMMDYASNAIRNGEARGPVNSNLLN